MLMPILEGRNTSAYLNQNAALCPPWILTLAHQGMSFEAFGMYRILCHAFYTGQDFQVSDEERRRGHNRRDTYRMLGELEKFGLIDLENNVITLHADADERHPLHREVPAQDGGL